jgi:hypothetical protein
MRSARAVTTNPVSNDPARNLAALAVHQVGRPLFGRFLKQNGRSDASGPAEGEPKGSFNDNASTLPRARKPPDLGAMHMLGRITIRPMVDGAWSR